MKSARNRSLAVVLVLAGLSACQGPGQPGPIERAGAHLDRMVAGAQRGVGDFSLRAGQGIDDAGRSVGATTQELGTRLHDSLVPPATSASFSASPAPAAR